MKEDRPVPKALAPSTLDPTPPTPLLNAAPIPAPIPAPTPPPMPRCDDDDDDDDDDDASRWVEVAPTPMPEAGVAN